MTSIKLSSNFTDNPSENKIGSVPVGDSGHLRINKNLERDGNIDEIINLASYNLGDVSISTHSYEGVKLEGIATFSIKNEGGFWHYSRKELNLDPTHIYTNKNMSLGAGFYIGLGDLLGTQVEGYKNDEFMKRYELKVTGNFLVIDQTSDNPYQSLGILLYDLWNVPYKSSRHQHIALNEFLRNNNPDGIHYDGIMVLKGNGVAEGLLFNPSNSNVSLES